jgi:hypothetical protein
LLLGGLNQFEKRFADFYEYELNQSENTTNHGKIDINSSCFFDLMEGQHST